MQPLFGWLRRGVLLEQQLGWRAIGAVTHLHEQGIALTPRLSCRVSSARFVTCPQKEHEAWYGQELTDCSSGGTVSGPGGPVAKSQPVPV